VTASDIENQLCVDAPELRFVRLNALELPFDDWYRKAYAVASGAISILLVAG
jgi:hypothetical protein